VVLAERQSAGRGRLGRTWDSPDRAGLYLSVVLRPTDPPERIGRYPIATAVAVCEACRSFAGDRVALKWPNDVLASGRKLAGVLAEMRQGPSGAELVLGIGINVDQGPDDFPRGLRAWATSLRVLLDGVAVEREAAAVLLERWRPRWRTSEGAGRRSSIPRYAPDGEGAAWLAGGVGLTCGLDARGRWCATER
jgi:BirA family biotin operon repressor/biotin-[acetyl-CoA-carboxylase] ligase